MRIAPISMERILANVKLGSKITIYLMLVQPRRELNAKISMNAQQVQQHVMLAKNAKIH